MSTNGTPRRIVVAVDNTPEGYASAELAAAWFSAEAQVLVIHVGDDESLERSRGTPPVGGGLSGYPVTPLGDLGDRIADGPEATREIAQRAARVAEGTSSIRTGKPVDQIVAAAEEWGADVIVMGAHHHNLLDRLLTNSTTHGVILEAPCPVLVAGPRVSQKN